MAESSSSSSSAPALKAKSDVEIEEMLDRMLTRLALCDDSKLEPLLTKLLPLSISSLSSQSISVRNKVLEILSHVNKRVKLQSDIGLPLYELWKLYSESAAAPMIRNFCIVYIEMAFQRVDAKVKEDLAPDLLVNISKLPVQHQEIILRVIVKVIGECHSGHIGDEVAAKYKNADNSQDRELFIEFCLHTMLYQRVSQSGGFPPGLSVAQANRVSGKQQLQSNDLLLRKLGILNVIQALELAPELVYPLYIAASVDCEEPVVKRGEELLKKKGSAANLDDLNLINRLFLLFNVFNTDNNHSIVQTYNFTTYKLCDYDDAQDKDTIQWSSSDPSNTEIHPVTVAVPLVKEGTTYFFSSDYDGDQCNNGQHFKINVTHGQGLPKSLQIPSENSPSPKSSPVSGDDDSAPDTIVPSNFNNPKEDHSDDDEKDSGKDKSSSVSVFSQLHNNLYGSLVLLGIVVFLF